MSLYLKYRPSDFTNLVWQSFVRDTLQKAIELNKTVWAYLLCWPRWTGKTSTARILAKAVNCENPVNWNPCLKCGICLDFTEDKLIDIIEIDAASHTWVDNIRELIEKAQFLPTRTKYKIYIIDEVHMLSKWAFNALLKILEEPPAHVKFILATTETHKVPDTIISRCQRYDFKRISDLDIRDRLWFIAKTEKIKTDKKSIEYIIKNSAGGLRNAISLFEQLIFDSEINYDKIVEKLEIVDENVINTFLEKLISKDSSVIEILDKNIADWKNIKLFFKELLFFTKNKSLELIRKGDSITDYIKILDILDETYSKTKNSLDENTTFLIWVLKILNWNNQINIQINDKKIVEKNIALNEVKKEAPVKIQENNKVKTSDSSNNELNHGDGLDVFWESITVKGKSSNEKHNSTSAFDSETFIEKLKENWAKSANINTIKNSNLSLKDNILQIKAPNAFLKKTINKSDIITSFIKALSEIWIVDPKIEIS